MNFKCCRVDERMSWFFFYLLPMFGFVARSWNNFCDNLSRSFCREWNLRVMTVKLSEWRWRWCRPLQHVKLIMCSLFLCRWRVTRMWKVFFLNVWRVWRFISAIKNEGVRCMNGFRDPVGGDKWRMTEILRYFVCRCWFCFYSNILIFLSPRAVCARWARDFDDVILCWFLPNVCSALPSYCLSSTIDRFIRYSRCAQLLLIASAFIFMFWR